MTPGLLFSPKSIKVFPSGSYFGQPNLVKPFCGSLANVAQASIITFDSSFVFAVAAESGFLPMFSTVPKTEAISAPCTALFGIYLYRHEGTPCSLRASAAAPDGHSNMAFICFAVAESCFCNGFIIEANPASLSLFPMNKGCLELLLRYLFR